MNREKNDSCLLTIHYDGAHIVGHKMKLDSFIESINGFNTLTKQIAGELGVPSDAIVLEILPLEQGGVKVNIVFAIVSYMLGMLSSNLSDHLLDDLHVYERLGVPRVVYRINQFLDRKKAVTNYKDLQQLTSGLDVEATRIMLNKQIHASAEQFVSALEYSADSLEISSTIDSNKIQLIKEDFPKFQNPFIEISLEENVYEEERVLRLDGPRYSGSEWTFYERDSKGNWNKENTIKAIVVDNFLLSLGRENSLQKLKDTNLYCTISCKEIIKPGNKKKTIERYIIRCCLNSDSLFPKIEKI